MGRRTITLKKTYRDKIIQDGKAENNGSIVEILEKYHSRLEYMTERYPQTSVMHLVVTTPEGVDTENANRAIGCSINCLKKNMKYKGAECQIGWVREIIKTESGEEMPHFHIGVLTNGKKIQSAVGLTEQLDRLWNKHTGDPGRSGYVHYCKPSPECDQQDLDPVEKASAIKIRQDKPNADKQFDNAFNWLSYPAQNVQKEQGPSRSKGFAFTSLPETPPKKKG